MNRWLPFDPYLFCLATGIRRSRSLMMMQVDPGFPRLAGYEYEAQYCRHGLMTLFPPDAKLEILTTHYMMSQTGPLDYLLERRPLGVFEEDGCMVIREIPKK